MAAGGEGPPPGEAKPLIVASMWGVTTPCVTAARERLEEIGYEVLVFHQTGTGGRSMEEVVKSGVVDGVLDVTTTELADELYGGIWPAGPERLGTAGRLGIPQVVSLGALDVIGISSTGLPDPLPDRFRNRPIYLHDEALAATRATPEECRELGAVIAHKLNAKDTTRERDRFEGGRPVCGRHRPRAPPVGQGLRPRDRHDRAVARAVRR
jgi:uncharacterized protein (UPF0261 family)